MILPRKVLQQLKEFLGAIRGKCQERGAKCQERDLRAFVKKAGYKIVGVWNGIASGAKQERPEPGVGAGPQGRRDPRHRTDQLGLLRP